MSTPWAWSGSAVTGPTQAGRTSWWRAARSSGSRPRSSARREQGRGGGGAGEGERVHAARDGGVEEPVDGADVLRRHPPVDGHSDDLGARRAQRLDEAGQRLTVQLDGDTASLDALLQKPVEHLGHGLGGRRPLLREPGRPDGALDLGAAGQQFHAAETGEQVVAEPQPSAASIQPRKPMAVVAMTMSGAWAISCLVAASSSLSSASCTIRRAGACMTAAPRRWRRAPSSSARRAAVTPTVNPARGPWSGGLCSDRSGRCCSSYITLVPQSGSRLHKRAERACQRRVTGSVRLHVAGVT